LKADNPLPTHLQTLALVFGNDGIGFKRGYSLTRFERARNPAQTNEPDLDAFRSKA
jgi:hypothetical protein